MVEEKIVWSEDDGYGDSKCDTDGNPFLIPSFITGYRPRPKDEFDTTTKHSRYDYVSSIVNNEEYIVGKAAYKLDPNIKWIGGENKHSDKRFPVLFKTCLGLMANDYHTTVDTMVMGLPVKSNTEKRIEQLERIVLDNHRVEVSYDGEVYIDRSITINNLIVKSQPFGSLCDVILDHNGYIRNKELAKGFNVIVDIGARTINVLTVDALEEVDALTDRTNDGMFTAYNEVGSYLEKELNVVIPDGKLPHIIQSKELNGLDISSLVEKSYENSAYNIKNMVEKMLINSWGFVSSVIFTGGGSELLKPHLNRMFMGKNTIFLDRYATSRGLRKYGLRKTMKNSMPQKVDSHG